MITINTRHWCFRQNCSFPFLFRVCQATATEATEITPVVLLSGHRNMSDLSHLPSIDACKTKNEVPMRACVHCYCMPRPSLTHTGQIVVLVRARLSLSDTQGRKALRVFMVIGVNCRKLVGTPVIHSNKLCTLSERLTLFMLRYV